MKPVSLLAWLMLAHGAAFGQTTSRQSSLPLAESNGQSREPILSSDGRFIGFLSQADNLVPDDTNNHEDLFVRDRQSGVIVRANVSSAGTQAGGPCSSPALSGNGLVAAFTSGPYGLVPGVIDGIHVYARDLMSGTTEIVSVSSSGDPGNATSDNPASSHDGRFVAFSSGADNLVPGDTNQVGDVFVHDRLTGATERVSVSSLGVEADATSGTPAISGDGRYVAFASGATNLTSPHGAFACIYVRDRLSGTTDVVSIATDNSFPNASCASPSISPDGRFVAFDSNASTLAPGDSNSARDVFLRDRFAGTTERMSISSGGVEGNLGSDVGVPSADGRYVAFRSAATNLVVPDGNGPAFDVYVRDHLLGVTERVTQSSAGVQANAASNTTPAISVDGRFVAFASLATNLIPQDGNSAADVFLRDREPAIASFCGADVGACPCGNFGAPVRGCDNSAGTGGASLVGSGTPSLTSDSLVLSSSGELPTALSIFLQGDTAIAPVTFGDGLRCAGGALRRLYVLNAVAGAVSAPTAGSTVSSRAIELGDALVPGASRFVQVYYRDPDLAFCAAPQGSSFNSSNAVEIVWQN